MQINDKYYIVKWWNNDQYITKSYITLAGAKNKVKRLRQDYANGLDSGCSGQIVIYEISNTIIY